MIRDAALQRAFRAEQRNHACTDCGLDMLPEPFEAVGSGVEVETVGGGYLTYETGRPVRELHILPHAGVELPTQLLREAGVDRFPELARLVHDNADIGTGAIHRALVSRVVRGRKRDAAVAGFRLSRVVVDVNRRLSAEQVSLSPYAGSADSYAGYLDRNRDTVVETLAAPWISAVNALLRANPGCHVYHHHTYDVFPRRERHHDLAPDTMRPAFQLFRARPAPHPPAGHDVGLAPAPVLERVRRRLHTALTDNVPAGETVCGGVDHPLLLPQIPFSDCLNDGSPRSTTHVIYEVRKDLLDSVTRIERWVEAAPWMVGDDR